MPVNIAATQGASTIPTKIAATRMLCIGISYALPERALALPDTSIIGTWSAFLHSTSAIYPFHFGVSAFRKQTLRAGRVRVAAMS